MPPVRAGYCRESTESEEQRTALETQRARLIAAGVDEIFEDVESGLNNERLEFNRLLLLVDRGIVEEVVCTRVDRLGRDAQMVDTFIAIAGKKKCKITALDGGEVESLTPQGFFMSRLVTTMAAVESKMISLRVKSAMKVKRDAARPMRKPPWGYKVSEDRSKLIPDPGEFEKAGRFLDFLEKSHWRMHAAMTRFEEGIPLRSLSSLKFWLLNPVIRGGLGYHRTKDGLNYQQIIWETHAPLISHERWAVFRAQLAINRNTWGKPYSKPENLLSGLCRCIHCNCVMVYNKAETPAPHLICRCRWCENYYWSVREKFILPVICKALSSRAEQLASIITADLPPEHFAITEKIALYRSHFDPMLEPVIAQLEQQLRDLSLPARALETDVAALRDPRIWELATPQELRVLLLRFVAEVQLTRPDRSLPVAERHRHLVAHVQLKI